MTTRIYWRCGGYENERLDEVIKHWRAGGKKDRIEQMFVKSNK